MGNDISTTQKRLSRTKDTSYTDDVNETIFDKNPSDMPPIHDECQDCAYCKFLIQYNGAYAPLQNIKIEYLLRELIRKRQKYDRDIFYVKIIWVILYQSEVRKLKIEDFSVDEDQNIRTRINNNNVMMTTEGVFVQLDRNTRDDFTDMTFLSAIDEAFETIYEDLS